MQIPKKKRTERLTATEAVYLTKDGIARMEARLERLKRELPAAAEEAAHAASFGDRSENDAYKQAKSILRRTQGQIWQIEDELKRVVEIKTGDTGHGTRDTVTLGSTVTIEDKNGKRQIYQLLGTLETNPERGIISNKSPLGAALMGKKKGETIKIQTARGTQEWKVREIL